jgi:hypothetical protein
LMSCMGGQSWGACVECHALVDNQHDRCASRTTSVIAREGGRSSIPETLVLNREAAAYWIPRLRGE